MKATIQKIIAIITLFIGSISYVHAQNKTENALLWEVSGNGLAKPSYLFGTIHMICEKDFVMKPKVNDAFAKTNQLVLEINMADPNELVTMQQLALGKEPLSKQLTKEQLAKLEEILKREIGIGVAQVDQFSLQTILSLISMKSFGCDNIKMYEMEFVAKAKQMNKPVLGLEKVKEQFDYMAKALDSNEIIEQLSKSDKQLTQQLVATYLNEDVSGLYEFSTNKEMMSATAVQWMLQFRNENWLKTMPTLMQKESTFFAVGAAHLGGEIGIIHLLRKAGYTVKPIMG